MPAKKNRQPQGKQYHGKVISKRDYKILKGIFSGYDKDNSGSVTYQEFISALEDEKNVDAAGVFAQMDVDHSGEVNSHQSVDRALCIPSTTHIYATFSTTSHRSYHSADHELPQVDFTELLMSYYPLCSREDVVTFIGKYDPKPREEVVKAERELTEEEEEELEALMRFWDKDKDGNVSLTEFKHQCLNAGMEEQEVEDWFRIYDTDGNKALDPTEFRDFFRGVWIAPNPSELFAPVDCCSAPAC